MAVKRYNATLRNLEYRLRKFKDYLPAMLEDIIMDKEDVIVSAIANDQLYRRGINGREVKIMSYAPYTETTKKIKAKKGSRLQELHCEILEHSMKSMFVVFDSEGFYVTANDEKTQVLIDKYGDNIFRLTDKNLTRIIRSHVRKELVKRIKQTIRG